MKRSILTAGVSAVGLIMGLASTASADDSGWYLRGNAGLGSHLTPELDGGIDSQQHTGGFQSESDVAYSLGLGYEFDDNWRVELDGDSLFTDLGAIGGASNSFGKLRTESLMLNAIYDFAGLGAVEPYLGAGLGLVRGKGSFAAHDFVVDGVARANPVCIGERDDSVFSCEVDDRDTAFGWQALAGFGVKITDNLTWDTHATYQDIGSLDFDGTVTEFDDDGSSTSPLITRLQDAALVTAVTGLRYRFGESTPPPPPPPPPAPVQPITYTCFDGTVVTDRALCPPPPPPPPPVQTTFTCEGSGQVVTDLALCPPRTECPDGSIVYGPVEFCPTRTGETVQALCGQEFRQEIIYYEFDRGQSAETRNTINRILDIGDFCQVNNIRVVGHTDTSGAASYNLNLSKRRAADAREELVRQGINPAIITSEGKGETEPFVQTGDGVKEQLNRRTEVLIQLSETGGMMMNN